jgi:hypothetical protein
MRCAMLCRMSLQRRHSFHQPWRPLLALTVMLLPTIAFADWQVQTQTDPDKKQSFTLAGTVNPDGHRLEIYRDQGNAIRARFTLADSLLQFAPKSCPTYQVDAREPVNRSINDAPCIATPVRAEYILGYVEDKQIESAGLLAFMNGVNVSFRFRLDSGAYRETVFSLGGSSSAIIRAIGRQYQVRAPR